MNKKNSLLKVYLRTVALGCIILVPGTNHVPPAQARNTVAAPNAYELTILVNATLSALNHANRTGNYSVLRDLSAPSFKRLNSQTQLGKIFATHRRRQLDISAALLYAPVFSKPPTIDQKGYLHLNGHIPTQPFHLNFALIYEKSATYWRIMALSIAPARMAAQSIAQK